MLLVVIPGLLLERPFQSLAAGASGRSSALVPHFRVQGLQSGARVEIAIDGAYGNRRLVGGQGSAGNEQ
jgi:hypothetical protein